MVSKEARQIILSLISCADTYGFHDDVLFDGFRELLTTEITEAEIQEYYDSLGEEYTIEDYLDIKQTITEFNKKYMNSL